MTDDLTYYIDKFSHLHTAKYKGKAAPHKAVLLLAVIELIEQGYIISPDIELSDVLVDRFNEIWNRYKGATSIFTADIGKPFFHMQHEPFWHLVEEGEQRNMLAESLGLPEEKKELPSISSYSIKSLRKAFRYAAIPQNLYDLILDENTRTKLKETLINTYLIDRNRNGNSITMFGIATELIFLLAS